MNHVALSAAKRLAELHAVKEQVTSSPGAVITCSVFNPAAIIESQDIAAKSGHIVAQALIDATAEIDRLKAELATARNAALQEAAKICDDCVSAAKENYIWDACRSAIATDIRSLITETPQ